MKIPKVGAYFASNVIQAGLQFLLVPLLVRALGPAEYGRWGLLEPIIAMLAVVAQFGTNWGILKLVNQDGVAAATALRTLIARGWWLASLVATASGVGVWWFRHDSLAALGLPLVVLAEAGLGLVLAAARSENRAAAYATGVIVKFGCITLLALSCVFAKLPVISTASELLMWWGAAVIAAAVSGGAMLLCATTVCERNDGNGEVPIGAAIAYGLPLLGAALLGTVLNSADRFVVERFVEPERLGAYVVALKVAGAMNFILTPVALWWPTARFEHLRDADGGQSFFADMAEKLALLYGVAGALLWIASPLLVNFFAPQVPYSASVLAGLCMAVVFRGMEPPLNIGLLKEGKTHWSMVMVGVGAIVQLLLCFFAVPKWGVNGAAYATAASSAISTGLVHIMSQRIHRVAICYGRIVSYAIFPWGLALTCKYLEVSIFISLVVVFFGCCLSALLSRKFSSFSGRSYA